MIDSLIDFITYVLQTLLAEGVELGLLLLEDLHVLEFFVHGEAALVGRPGLLSLLLHGRGRLAVSLGSGLVLLKKLLLLALKAILSIIQRRRKSGRLEDD